MDGYAGLVVIDHSKESLYSLYGHLSLKSDMVELGPIKRGDIVGYIAEPSESYGIGTVSHLHFALRLGEKADYSKLTTGCFDCFYSPFRYTVRNENDGRK